MIKTKSATTSKVLMGLGGAIATTLAALYVKKLYDDGAFDDVAGSATDAKNAALGKLSTVKDALIAKFGTKENIKAVVDEVLEDGLK